jgi:uncharacterized protein (DUF2249 family)
MTATLPPGAADLVLASGAADAAAVDAVRQRHAELSGRLTVHAEALLAASTGARPGARPAALRFCAEELLPWTAEVERSLYPVATRIERLRALVDALVRGHRALEERVRGLARSADPVHAAADGAALLAVFETHVGAVDDLVLPAVAADPAISLAGALAGLRELFENPRSEGAGGMQGVASAGAGCGCGCGGHDDVVPVLDVRTVPHEIRHATVFGAFDAVPDGAALLLVAPHDPLPLLRQLSDRTGGALAVDYEERGPQVWRLRLTRA